MQIFAAIVDAATPVSVVAAVTRIRNTEASTWYEARVSLKFNLSNLPDGAATLATISDPSEFHQVTAGGKGSQITFATKLPLESLSAASGNWSLILGPGTLSEERFQIVIPNRIPDSFPAFPPIPIAAYGGDPFKVFISTLSSPGESINTLVLKSSSQMVLNTGYVYTFPAGGPFEVMGGRSINPNDVDVIDGNGSSIGLSKYAGLESNSLIHFVAGSEARPFAARCDPGEKSVEIATFGLEIGAAYTLFRSADLKAWEEIESFPAVSNCLVRDEPVIPNQSWYYRMAHTS